MGDVEIQSEYSRGFLIPNTIHAYIVEANKWSHNDDFDSFRQWLRYLQDIDRMISPRIKTEKHAKELEAVRVYDIPGASNRNSYGLLGLYRKKLMRYQITLESIGDKLGLGFKPTDDPRNAMLK